MHKKVETEWVWSGGTTSTKDTCSKIWGDGEGAAVIDDAVVYEYFKIP